MGCEQCSCKNYIRIVNGTKMPEHQYDLVVVGESISPIEAKSGILMTGHGAEVLQQTMKEVGLPFSRDAVYYTTAIKCAVPKKKGQKFPKDAAINCRASLLQEIKAAQPKLVLVCGAVALATLTGTDKLKVTEEYGRVREYPFLPGIKVIPIMNPGVLLHSPGEYKPFLTMLQLAATIFGGGKTNDTGETRWTICDTKEKCVALWRKMQNIEICSMDIETTGLDYRTAEFLVLGICFERNHTYIIPREMQDYVNNFTDTDKYKTVWQHGKYDKKVLWRRKLGSPTIGGDTMYQHYVLDESSAHDLGYLTKVFLNAEEYKYKMNQNWKAVTLETYKQFFTALCERVAVDCDYTLQLYHRFNTILNKEENAPLLSVYNRLLIPGANFLSRVEQNGLLIDENFLHELDKKYVILLQDIKVQIEEMANPYWDALLYQHQTKAKTVPAHFNPGSPAQMAWIVFDRLKLKPRIHKGRSTDKAILASIENAPPLIKKVLEYRAVQKEHSTYVIGLLDAQDDDGCVRTTFNLHSTVTGRLSSKEPNVQNQPSAHGVGNIRKAFIARTGRILLDIDYSGAELRWLAFLSKCPVLSEVFMQNRNLHVETARKLFGEHYTKVQKMRAKAVNFGIPYGREAQSLSEEYNFPKAEAQKMIDDWLNTYYGARDYLEWCAEQVVEGNYLETPFGRRRRFGLVSPMSLHNLQNEAKNFPISSSSSDLLLTCCMEMEQTLKKEFDINMLNLVHDSTLLDAPAKKSVLMAASKYAGQIMTQKPIELFNCPIPFKVDYDLGINWGEQVAFNCETGNVEIENEDDSITIMDFDEWYEKETHNGC